MAQRPSKAQPAPAAPEEPGFWTVYVLQSLTRAVTYVGIAKDVQARLAQHNGLAPGGAKSTRAGRPWILENCLGPYAHRGLAQAIEYRVKRLAGAERLSARSGDFPEVARASGQGQPEAQ